MSSRGLEAVFYLVVLSECHDSQHRSYAPCGMIHDRSTHTQNRMDAAFQHSEAQAAHGMFRIQRSMQLSCGHARTYTRTRTFFTKLSVMRRFMMEAAAGMALLILTTGSGLQHPPAFTSTVRTLSDCSNLLAVAGRGRCGHRVLSVAGQGIRGRVMFV